MKSAAWLAALASAAVITASMLAPVSEVCSGPVRAASQSSAAGNDKTSPGRSIRGRLVPPDRVLDAYLWERAMDLRIPLKVDPKTGAFEVTGLRLGTYDIVIQAPWGRLEGIDMEPKVSEYDALIPPQYRTEDLGKPADGSFSDQDRAAIRRIIHEVKRYENKIRDIMISGCADKAVALVELMMDGDFVGRKGDEITWRIEQWYYEKKYDAWTTYRMRCLYRFRVSKAVWQTWGWQFEPALGGFNITEDRTEPVTVEFTVPERPSAEKGLAGDKLPPADKGRPREPPPPDEN